MMAGHYASQGHDGESPIRQPKGGWCDRFSSMAAHRLLLLGGGSEQSVTLKRLV